MMFSIFGHTRCLFTSLDIATYIVHECDAKGIMYNTTKIQKLLYCAYGVMLAWRNRRICDEQPVLYPYGPVFRKVFKYFKRGDVLSGDADRCAKCDDIQAVVSQVLEVFGRYTAVALADWASNTSSPWRKALAEDRRWGSVIPDEYIREYFKDNVVGGEIANGAAN